MNTITMRATCPQCGKQNIRIEYSHGEPRRYRIVCRCGYSTPEAENLNDCAVSMRWQKRADHA